MDRPKRDTLKVYAGRHDRYAARLVRILAGAACVTVLVCAVLVFRGKFYVPDEILPETCRTLTFEEIDHIVCEVHPGHYDIRLGLRDAQGNAYGSLDALAKSEPFLFAMNAGMYHEGLSPVGLYVEDGAQQTPLNLGEGEGNFFLKPNGVFYIDGQGHAGVAETGHFAASGIDARQATQSGPMLVIDGLIHPRFEPNGSSRYIRNGVGVRDDGTVVFAISRREVSLGRFARLFRDGLGCRNALFFDGGISALHDGKHYLVGGDHPAGPIAAVSHKLQ